MIKQKTLYSVYYLLIIVYYRNAQLCPPSGKLQLLLFLLSFIILLGNIHVKFIDNIKYRYKDSDTFYFYDY